MGLVCPNGTVGHTGVAGLTLGGGVGRLQRNFGLTIDHLAAVELVTSDGRFVRASETEEPELFWGIRGAGWNFGIVTAFEFRLEPFGPSLHRGFSIYPMDQIQEAWTIFRDYAPGAPDSVSVIFGLDRAGEDEGTPDDLNGQPIAYIAYNHSGAADRAERDTAGLRRGSTPVFTNVGSQSYLDVQVAHDLVFDWGHRSYFVGFNAVDLHPEALPELVELVAQAPGRSTFSVTALGGAIGRVDEDATAYAGRAAPFDFSTDTAWDDPADDEANRRWVRQVVSDRRIKRHARPLCERHRRLWSPGITPDLRRREIRPTGPSQARLGPGQRLPPEPQCGSCVAGGRLMKLSAMLFVTLDGVYQGPGARDEDRRGGFERGGWLAPYADKETFQFITSVYERADALLLGRETWDIWASYWPEHDGGDPVSHGINVLPKFVPSSTLKDPTWQNTHVIGGDVEAAVRELKAEPGRELQVHGSGALLRWLLERDLVDELHLLIYPVVVGDGLRLFPERGPTHDLALLESKVMPNGVTIQTYRPAGRATFGDIVD